MTDAPRARILLADDLPLFRRAIATLIDEQDDMQVVGQASNGIEAIELAQVLHPDIILLDVEMPVMDGITAAGRLREVAPRAKIIMLTVVDDDEHLLAAIRLGVHGYLLKDLHPNDLFAMVRSAMQGISPVAPSLVGRLLAAVRTTDSPAGQPAEEATLSMREIEVLRLVANGMSNKEIGVTLSITAGTVKNHVHNALTKLDMDNRVQAAAYIVRHGLGLPRA